MAKTVRSIPEGYHTLTPHIVVDDAKRALEFYQRALGAEEVSRMPAPDGKIMHAEIRIGDSLLMLADEFPNAECRAPRALRGTTVSLMIYTNDVDQAFKRAIEAGARQRMAPEDMFWGDRYCTVEDPFGHIWALATHIEDVSPTEMADRAKRLFGR